MRKLRAIQAEYIVAQYPCYVNARTQHITPSIDNVGANTERAPHPSLSQKFTLERWTDPAGKYWRGPP